MPPNKILGWLHQFHIGIAFDLLKPESRNLTITNKILHYLLAGLPVIASKTEGHREIASNCQSTVLIPNNSDELKQTLSNWFDGGQNSIEIQKKAWEDGKKFCWEVESQKLKNLILGYYK
jgi:glycosyltransferase involved in cell wall biosynthesis